MEEYTKEAKTWFTILDAALKIPGAKIDREKFLQKAFEKYCNRETVDKILQVGTEEAGVEITLMEKVSADIISQHTRDATISSVVAGIPGGLAMAESIPADVIQYYYHVIVAAQQIAYTYGFKSVEDAEFKPFLTLLIGQMSGIAEADTAFKELAAAQFNKKIGKITLGKILDKTITRVAVAIGVQLSKRGIIKAGIKAVPLVGGIVSGGMTFLQLKPMCDNLKNKLYDSIEAKRNNKPEEKKE
jgi:hypothetical protein